MNKSILRMAGLTSCMLLALSAGTGTAPVSARAQTPPTGTGTQATPSFLQTLTTNTLQQVTSGQMTAAQGAQALAGASVPGIGGQAASAAQFQQMFTALQGNRNVNLQSAIGLFGSVASGQMPPQVGQALAGIPNLGNIVSGSGATSAFQTAAGAINQFLNPSTAANPAAAAAQQAGLISNAAAIIGGQNAGALLSNPNSPFSQAAQQAIATQFPQLSQFMSGAQLSQTLANLGQQLAGQVGGVAGAVIGGLLGGAGGSLVGGVLGTGGSASGSAQPCNTCCSQCTQIHNHYIAVRDHVTSEFNVHRRWFLTVYWLEHILPALMLMAEQLTVAGIHQVEIIGSFLDAKHQLETQRLFQELTARAHKDYQPSEGMCTFGTTVRSLAASERLSDIAQVAMAERLNQRQTMRGDVLSVESTQSDIRSRLNFFIQNYCDPADNANGLGRLCRTAPPAARRNIDVDYTRNIESRLTLDMNFTQQGTATADEQDVFALAANLYSHNVAPRIMPELMGDGQGLVRLSVLERYMDLRAIFAKRSVAQNSFAAMTSMRTSGDAGSAPYTKALMRELGVQNQADIERILGVNPSYFAQMEVLTKKLYQNPVFYTELYDKPANVERKGAALQAIALMQDRDLYNSLLRSEAVLSVLLETMLEGEQEKVTNAYRRMEQAGGAR